MSFVLIKNACTILLLDDELLFELSQRRAKSARLVLNHEYLAIMRACEQDVSVEAPAKVRCTRPEDVHYNSQRLVHAWLPHRDCRVDAGNCYDTIT